MCGVVVFDEFCFIENVVDEFNVIGDGCGGGF